MEENPLKGIRNVTEVAKVVNSYQVVLGQMTIKIEILYFYHLPPSMCYMAVPSHALVLDGSVGPYCPLRNYASEQEALRDLVMEFALRIEPEWGSERWVTWPVT